MSPDFFAYIFSFVWCFHKRYARKGIQILYLNLVKVLRHDLTIVCMLRNTIWCFQFYLGSVADTVWSTRIVPHRKSDHRILMGFLFSPMDTRKGGHLNIETFDNLCTI